MIKKIFLAVLLVILWSGVNSISAPCAEFFMLTAGGGTNNLKVGGSAGVDIFMDTVGENIAAADVIVEYDSSILEAVSVDTSVSDMVVDLGGGTMSVAINNIDNSGGRVHFVAGVPAPNYVNGPVIKICRINFKALCAIDSTNKNPLTIVSFDITADDGTPDCKAIIAGSAGEDVLNKSAAGNIYLSIKSGDIDANGLVNTLDMLKVRNLMGTSETEKEYDMAADVNKDGIINTLDLLKIRNLMGT